jgi:hypothetical protein
MLLLLNTYTATEITNHSINKSVLFRHSKLYGDHQNFINQFCDVAPKEVKADLEGRFIYYRVYLLLEQLNKILEKPGYNVILDYEHIQYKYKVLIGICAMKYTVSVTHNKVRDIDYVTLSTSFEPRIKTNYVRDVHRIVGRLDSYSGRNDPKLYLDARNKYFQELMDKYDAL